jgi:signal transduction histidine kinase/DNA-binding response OmpR family regulator
MSIRDLLRAPLSLVARLGDIGNRPTDTQPEMLRHRLLVFMGCLMSMGGLLWGSIAAWFGLLWPAVIPYGYVVLTALNLTYFRQTKDFRSVRVVQVLISLLLPFFFQFTLGGFAASGAVMLWSMLAIVGALTFSESRAVVSWLFVYSGFTVAAGLLDGLVRARFAIDASEPTRTAFFVINIVVISGIVFGLTIHLLAKQEAANAELEKANQKITTLNEGLEHQVAKRTLELAAALAQTRAIIDHMVDGLVAIAPDGRVTEANPAVRKLLGLDQKLDPVALGDSLPPAMTALAKRSVGNGEVVRSELLVPGRVLAAVASPIQATAGSVVLLRDMTLEKEIDRMKTDFIATVSHELRTPLTSVLGFTKISRNKLDTVIFPLVPPQNQKATKVVDQVRRNLEIISAEGERLTNLIADVLDISKMEAGRMEWRMRPLAPAALLERATQAISSLVEARQVKLVREIAPDLPMLNGDFDRLVQVVLNLISNAVKFAPGGTVRVGAMRVGEGLELWVNDTGPGIDPANHETIFEKFRQVGSTLTGKPEGTGLGLSICNQIVTAHGGKISVESRLGAGAKFTVSLPLGASPSVSAHGLVEKISQRAVSSLPNLGRDLLVVDDDANLRELLQQQLSDRGYTVRLAADGYAALEAVRERPPSAVILDLMMPGISGYDVAAVLKSNPATRSIPILVLSVVEDAQAGFRVGVDSYIHKPHQPDQLVHELEGLIGTERTRRRVLLVDESLSGDVARQLVTRGYELVGTATCESLVDEARRTRPDLVIIDAAHPRGDQVLRDLRMHADLEHVVVLRLLDDTEAVAQPPLALARSETA